jgi:glycosyltransferase involved in cell wall biosynthesis
MVNLFFFTIVIPLYNQALYVEKAIKSALGQDYKGFEILVVDDGSTDNGADVVRQIKSNHIQLIQQQNQGVSVARNIGIKNANGNIIAFLDADDEWLPNHLEVLARLATNFPEAAAYATGYQKKLRDGRLFTPNFKFIPAAPWEGIVPNYFKSVATGPELMWTSAVAIRKIVFEKVGYFQAGMRNGQDADMWLRIALEYPIVFSREITAIYCLGSSNSSTSRLKSETDFKSHYFVEWPKMGAKKDSYLNEYIAKKQLILLTELYLSGYRNRVRTVIKSVKTRLHKKAMLKLYIKTFFKNQTLKKLSKIKKKLIKESGNQIDTDKFV